MVRASLLFGFAAAIPLAAAAQTPSPPKPFTAAGSTLYYYETGARQGIPLILLSGGPGFNSEYFWIGPEFRELGKSRWVLTYDQRGTGRSAPVGPKDSSTVAGFVADLEALRVALNVPKVDLLGHSWGGYLAQAYAATHGDRIAHLVLVGSAAPKFSDTQIIFNQAFPERDMSTPLGRGVAQGDTALVNEGLRIYLTMIFYDDAKGRAWRKQGERINNFNLHLQTQLGRELAKLDFTAALPAFRFPTLVTTGRYDMNVSALTAWRIHQAIPSSKFLVFEESGHFPFYEESDRFVAALRTFLGQ